jgi:hypothetical protein
MTNGIYSLEEMPQTDVSPLASLTLSMFLGACMCGWTLYDLYVKSKRSDDILGEISHSLEETAALQESQAQALVEHDQRIREKKDYDDTEEAEEGKYQAWKGSVKTPDFLITIFIWREKISTIRKNQDWLCWDGSNDGSCVVRDFYLGNSNPDFEWKLQKTEDLLHAVVEETMVNGWDSVVKLKINMGYDSDESLLTYTGTVDSEDIFNAVLKKTIHLISWERILLDA